MTPETSTRTESTGSLFKALRSVGVEPELAYRADDEVRNRAGRNVVSVIGAKIDARTKEIGARLDAQGVAVARIDNQGADLEAKIEAQGAELGARIDDKFTQVNSRISSIESRMDAQAVRICVSASSYGRPDLRRRLQGALGGAAVSLPPNRSGGFLTAELRINNTPTGERPRS